MDTKEYIACDAVCLVITRNDIDSIPLLSLSGYIANRYVDYGVEYATTPSPTPNMPIMYKLIKRQDLCVEGLVTASVAVSVPLSVDGLVGGNVDDLGLSLLGVVDGLNLGSRGDSSGLNLEVVVAVSA